MATSETGTRTETKTPELQSRAQEAWSKHLPPLPPRITIAPHYPEVGDGYGSDAAEKPHIPMTETALKGGRKIDGLCLTFVFELMQTFHW